MNRTPIDEICIAIMFIPMALILLISAFMLFDEVFYSWPLYRKFMYGNLKRDDEGKVILMGQFALILGGSCIVLPSIIIGIYLYYTDMPYSVIIQKMVERLI